MCEVSLRMHAHCKPQASHKSTCDDHINTCTGLKGIIVIYVISEQIGYKEFIDIFPGVIHYGQLSPRSA